MASSSQNKPDERLVYLALNSVFIGEDAKIRNARAIRKQIHKHQGKEEVRALLKNHNPDHVYNTTKKLLENRIFESTLSAKIRFPEVFRVSPAQSADREQSEEEVAKSEVNAFRNATEGRMDDLEAMGSTHALMSQRHEPLESGRQQPLHEYSQQHHLTLHLPSLYPIYLPFETQHRLLNKVQNVLENSCYTFATTSLPEVLEKNGWDCPERGELHVWARTLAESQFSKEALAGLGKPLEKLLESIAHLRHTAVHRLEVSANRVFEFLLDAERLAILLEDDNAAARVARKRVALELAVEEMKRNKDLLNFRATKTLQDLDEKIAELKRLQEVAIGDMLNEDRTFRRWAVADLEIAIDVQETSEQHGEEEGGGGRVLSETEDIMESSSEVGIEGEEVCGLEKD